MSSVQLEYYIFKVLKQAHPERGMTSEVKESFNTLLNLVLRKLVSLASDRVLLQKRQTLQPKDIDFAVSLFFPGELQKKVSMRQTASLVRWRAFGKDRGSANGTKTSVAVVAGLTFPPTAIGSVVRELTPAPRVSKTTGISLAAVLEQLSYRLGEIAGNTAAEDKKVLITAMHLFSAVEGDADLSTLFKGTLLPGGFV